jgi:D-alanyl-D-alanine dipeptidase
MEQGFRIKVWDAYRPQKSHEILYEKTKDGYYFMDPKIGSNHTRGASVDVTLVDAEGKEVNMPSRFDEMSRKAHRTYELASPEQKKNALLLEKAMEQAGFIPLENEWWHFDDTEYKSYDFIPELFM